MSLTLTPIGKIHSPYTSPSETPKQGFLADTLVEIEIFPEFSDALLFVKEGERYVLLYFADRADRTALQTTPPWADKPYGVFGTRSPHRPNPISICTVELCKIDGNRLTVKGLDALNDSPLLDMKAYIPENS